MAFNPLVWYCRPIADGYWDKVAQSALGSYTPCGVYTLVVPVSNVFFMCICIYRILLIKKNHKVHRYKLKSRGYHLVLILLSGLSTTEPLFRIAFDISIFNAGEQPGLPPFEFVSLLMEGSAWASMVVLAFLETSVYIRECQLLMRFGIVYVLVGDVVMVNLLLSMKDHIIGLSLHMYISGIICQVVVGALLLFHIPKLDPYPGHSRLQNEMSDSYEALNGEEEVCPERHVSVFSWLFFEWISPLMQQGYKRPITEKDVWKLDEWDRSDILSQKFHGCWVDQSIRPKPSLLKALNCTMGGRFWLGGIYKFGEALGRFVGPVILNLLLQSMQRGDPAWICFIYVFFIFSTSIFFLLIEGQFLQCVFRVGLRVRATLVSAIFRKSLRLTYEAHKNFPSGKIMNMISTDANVLQQICQQLHDVWSDPFQVIVSLALLYQQLGISSIIGSLMLVLMIPVQTILIRKLRILAKEGLQFTDRRVSLMNEMLVAMDTVKCRVWEDNFQTKIQSAREDELSWFLKSQLMFALNSFLLNSVPVCVTVVSFGLFTLLGGDLTPARAFTSLSLFTMLRFPLSSLPGTVVQIANANVSLRRVEEFLSSNERMFVGHLPIEHSVPAISIRNGCFSWDFKSVKHTLSSINVDIPVGSLVAIVGGTGDGKTSLISAMLGEVPSVLESSVVIRGRVAYVPQISWIFNGTLRENILFGQEYDAARYWEAIDVTELQHDLKLLPGYDLTEIGERGVNISGGQKQRVSMARAVYSNADVYVFDDPLSALDANVGRQVFHKCIKDKLGGKTRVLVTNQLHFLPLVDKIILMSKGTIIEKGTFDELSRDSILFQRLMENAGEIEEYGEHRPELNEDSVTSAGSNLKDRISSDVSSGKAQKTGMSILIKEEERETGVIDRKVLIRYINALGGLLVVIPILVCYVSTEAFRLTSSSWLSSWTNDRSSSTYKPHYYILIYTILSLMQVMVTLANSFWSIIISLSAARRLHDSMLNSIMRAPMLFFHTNPCGRIINRFAKDIGDVDRYVANRINMFLSQSLQLLSTFVLIGLVSVLSFWAIMPILILFYAAFIYYQSTSRELKRLDSVTLSPIYARFGEALNGLSSIRAYNAYDWVTEMIWKAVDNNIRFGLASGSANRWRTIRLEILGCIMILFTATCFSVIQSSRVENQVGFASAIGLLLSYTLNITSLMSGVLREASQAENSLNAVERVGTYIDLPSEAPSIIESNRPPIGWPALGSIEFEDVLLRYRPGLPSVLHGLSFKVSPGEKIGVVGRTGAGKSSMLNALFRLVELERGRILIDGLDLAKFGLADVRQSLSIIPQSPVLFSGTIRSNLDPFGEHSDTDLWEVLDRAHLKNVLSELSYGLDAKVLEGGENFSVGQRQLLSLARALLVRSRIIVVDEATASVDLRTDALIQKTIREEFKSSTMLIIAHRLNTVVDCDRILVIDAGQVQEYDHPKQLLLQGSAFWRMVQSTGSANAQYLCNVVLGCDSSKNTA